MLRRRQPIEAYRMLTIRDVCVMASISRSTFYRLRNAGIGPEIVYVGQQPRIREAAFRRWIRSCPTIR